ncbi:hypothetical protein EMCRGX_G016946 [Ephydatia muelleri]
MLLRLLLWKKEWEFARKFREADRKMIAYMLEVFFNMLHHREGIRNLEIENEIETINMDQSTSEGVEMKKLSMVSIPSAPETNVIISHSTVIDTHGILRSKLAMTILSFYVANIASLAIVVFWDVFILTENFGCSDEFDSFYENSTLISQYCSCIPIDDQYKAKNYDIALEFPTAIAEVAGILFLGYNGFAFLMFLKLLVADGVASLCPRIVIYLLLGATECLVVIGIIGAFVARRILLEKEDATNVIIEQELGWSCIPLAVETYGNWGKEAQDTISRLASHLAIHQSSPKSSVVAEIYGQLNMTLVLSIARATLARELPPS